jgi:hypothetical protein
VRNTCFRDDGTPRSITRVSFELLAPGRIRWELWADVDVLNHSEVITPAELPGVLEITRSLLGGGNAEEGYETKTAVGVEDRAAAD